MNNVNVRVAAKTNSIRLSDSIIKIVLSNQVPLLTSAGPWANNQLIKALARARDLLKHKGIFITWYSEFRDDSGKNDNDEISILETYVIVEAENDGK